MWGMENVSSLFLKKFYDTMLVEYESTMGKLETITGPDGTKSKMNLTAFGYEVVYDLEIGRAHV